ncbi:MAG TPA: BatA domain-containing protein, partial [Verrucomicrobiae bacterium]|nr:BatA domain-containing protein [Verrucomicrobiae bacterium]
PVSLLAPLFLLGALAVALPVIFHLIRRTSKEKVPFSSLMFLQPTPPRMTRRNRLENIFLLLLRCLVLCLLALGFARPFFQKPVTADPQNETARKIILLVDTSASMRREGLWAAALSKAEEALNKASVADQMAVFTFDRRVRPLVSFEQWAATGPSERASLATGRLAEVNPGWASTHAGNALITAAEAFADADKQGQDTGPRRIVLVSDLQEGSRLEGLQGYDWPRGIEVVIESIKAKRPTNAGLQWVMDADEASRPETDAGPRIRVSNSADAKREQFQIRWDGVAGGSTVDAYVPPGQSRIVQAPKLPAGISGERLVLTGDDDDFDNIVYLVEPKAEQVTILFIGNDTEKDPGQALYYLKRAFQETRRQVVRVVVIPPSAALSPTDLADKRLMIVGDPLSEASLKTAQQFLTGGGTVLLGMKDTASAQTVGKLAEIDNLVATEAASTTYSMFGQIDFEHPLFAPFADPRYSDFTKIHFWKHRRLGADRVPGARVVARFDDGDPALLEIPKGTGRLLVLTSSWQPVDSQLALSSKFVPLLYSILEQAGGIKAQISQYHVGDDVNLSGVSPPTNGPSLTIRKPDGAQVQLGAGETRYSDAGLPGIYTIASTQPPLRFAVNLDAAESKTALLPVEELARLNIPLKPREIELAKQIEQKRRLHNAELENQQKLWRWLIVAALVVLLMETWLAGWLTRQAGTRTEASA